jgi:hypothetical protein
MTQDKFAEQTIALVNSLTPQEQAIMRLMIEQAMKEARQC